MVVHYIIGIALTGGSGKEKATLEKIRYLEAHVEELNVFSLRKKGKSALQGVLAMMVLDFRHLWMLLIRQITRPDVIVTRNQFILGSYLAGRIFRIPVVRELHADAHEEILLLHRDKKSVVLMSGMYHAFFNLLLRQSSGIIYNHPLLQRHYEQTRQVNVPGISVYNGTDPNTYYPRAGARAALNLEPDLKHLVFVGSLSPWHGVEYLLAVQDELTKLREDTVLLVIGGNETAVDHLKSISESIPRVKLIGQVPQNEAAVYISAADACLLPVRANRVSPGSPLKLFDYIACGAAVIAQADTVGYSDVVEEFRLGIACDFTMPEQAASEISQFLDTQPAGRYTEHNYRIAMDHHLWEHRMGEWADFLRVITAPQGSSSVSDK